ncbi:MAG: HAMP domain-containing protein [Sutterella sp.]|nr:HAMP domain-containing protein [Sutterella sp.]
MKIPKFFRSLSTRLLFLTLLWVSFIVSSIGWTMLLNWELEASAAAKFSIAELRMQVYRSAYFTQPIFPEKLLDEELTRVTNQFRVIRVGDAWQPLELPREGDFHASLETLEKRWKTEVEPMLIASKKGSRQVDAEMVRVYTSALTDLAGKIDAWRYDYLWQLRYLQILLIVLAIGSLFTIMLLLLRWVIRPIGNLGEGINRLSGGDLAARVEVKSDDEIGRIAVGFNRMADRLEDLYNNLEQKVAEKTASVEEKNRHLAQLYETTSFFSQQRSIEELTDGFAERIVRYTEADACLVTLVDQKAGFTTAYCFNVRSVSESIGSYMLIFREESQLSSQMTQLLESFAMHLGVAIDNQRLIDRDRQYAVIQERQLLAQGLHDSIAQALSYLNLQVQFLSDAIRDKDEKLRDESLEAIRTGVQECYEDVRELLLNFRERLHNEGFLQGVRTVIDRFEGQAHIGVRLSSVGDGPKLTPREKLQVIFIIQEALSNVRKHAQASSVKVSVRNEADLTVEILDDGVGIDQAVVEERKNQHVGLSIMQERASRIGAVVTVERASPIGGTRVVLKLPAAARQIS